MRLKKYHEWLNEDAQIGKTSIDSPADYIISPVGEEESETSNYMFFSNLGRIQELAKMILSMDQTKVDAMLNNGHDWANDHITTAKTNLDHVFGFLKGELKESVILEAIGKTVDLHRQYAMTPNWWAAWRDENEKDNGYEINKDSFSKTYEVKDKTGKIIFVFDYRRNKIFTNESPSVFVLKNDMSSDDMKDLDKKAQKIKDDLSGVDQEQVDKEKAEAAAKSKDKDKEKKDDPLAGLGV
jgi:hypothetical protein